MIKNINKKEQIFNFLVKTTLRSELTFPWKGWIFFALAKKDQGSVERRSQMLIRKDLTVYCKHYLARYRGHHFVSAGNLPRNLPRNLL